MLSHLRLNVSPIEGDSSYQLRFVSTNSRNDGVPMIESLHFRNRFFLQKRLFISNYLPIHMQRALEEYNIHAHKSRIRYREEISTTGKE